MAIIRCKLDVTKIDKAAIFAGAKGKYIDITLLENRDGVDQYGNLYMVVQEIGKERRLAGEKGPILGNGKVLGDKQQAAPAPQGGSRFSAPAPRAPVAQENLDENVPF